MAYSDRSPNWGAIVAAVIAAPIGLIWTFVEVVGATMGCEGNSGPCGPKLFPLLAGIMIIAVVPFILGRLLNHLVAGWRTTQD